MLLPYIYRFTVYNDSTSTIPTGSLKVLAKRNRLNVSGVIEYEDSYQTILSNSANIPTGAYVTGTTQTNTGNWYGGDFFLVATGITFTSLGQAVFYLERSVDGSLFDVNNDGLVVGAIGSGSNYRAISL